MGTVDQSHAGIASGINNAVSRTAGLLAVAILGVIMLAVFSRGLERRIEQLPIPAADQEQITAARNQFVDIRIPESFSDNERADVKAAINESFVDGFRVVSIIAGVMAVCSALFALFLISGKKTNVK
jgi:hypothetical protein